MSIRTKGKEIILRALLLCLCAVLAVGCACAEETKTVNLGNGGKNSLVYGTTLSDGRILMVGTRAKIDESLGSGRLLCLNPDRTVSWEYIDDGFIDGRFIDAAELEDGTIGLVFGHLAEDEKKEYKYQYALRFFTTDGEPTGQVVNIPFRGDQMDIRNATKSRLQMDCMTVLTEAGENQYRSVRDDNYLIDWEGKETALMKWLGWSDATSDMIEEPDGLVMNGYSYLDDRARESVLKTDLQGETIWETKLECAWPDTYRADAKRIIRSGDGGYLVLQEEPIQPEGDTEWRYRYALVKLDGEGKVLWTRTEGFEGTAERGWTLAAAGGKIAVSFLSADKNWVSFRADSPRRIAWFDENGKFLGNVELELDLEYFPQLKRTIQRKIMGKEPDLLFYEDRMISMDGGLWMSGKFIVEYNDNNNVAVLEYYNTGLFKVPEPSEK